MFGEHYGSLLTSSGALVDLENELQSGYMSTKLNQFGLTWNLSNNSKYVRNQRFAITKVVPNYNFFLHDFS
jgi:hypothetical protein